MKYILIDEQERREELKDKNRENCAFKKEVEL